MQVAVLGAGAFGTSIAKSLERKHEVTLWARTGEGAAEIERTRESPHLKGHKLGAGVKVTGDLAEAVRGKSMIVAVTPSHAIRSVLGEAAKDLSENVIIVNASKGLEEGTLATIDRIYE